MGATGLTVAGSSLRIRDAAGQASPHFQLLDAAGNPLPQNDVQLAAGATLAVSVQFRPVTAGQHQGTMQIATAAAAQPAVMVSITGRGVA